MRARNYLQSVILLFAVLRVCSSEAEVMAVLHENYRHDPVIEIAIDNYIKSAEAKGHKIIKVFAPTQTLTELEATIYANLLVHDVAFKDIFGINFYGPVLSTRVNLNSVQVSGYGLFRLRNINYDRHESDVVSVKKNNVFDKVRWVSHQTFKSNKELTVHLNKSAKNIAPNNSVNLGIKHLESLDENIRKCEDNKQPKSKQQLVEEALYEFKMLSKGCACFIAFQILSSPRLTSPNPSYSIKVAKNIAKLVNFGAAFYYLSVDSHEFIHRYFAGEKKITAEEFCHKLIMPPVINNDGLLKISQKSDQEL